MTSATTAAASNPWLTGSGGLGEIRAQLVSAGDQLDDTRVWLDMMGDQLNFSYADAEQTRRAQERLWMLLASAEGQLGVAIELAGAASKALHGTTAHAVKAAIENMPA
jgi:hypothetical protein